MVGRLLSRRGSQLVERGEQHSIETACLLAWSRSDRGADAHPPSLPTIRYDQAHDPAVFVDKNTKVSVSGISKEAVGQAASEIRGFRPPDAYKGKGVRYEGEYVRIKAGKTAQ